MGVGGGGGGVGALFSPAGSLSRLSAILFFNTGSCSIL